MSETGMMEKEQGKVEKALESVFVSIDSLESNVTYLEKVLAPVLRAVPPSTTPDNCMKASEINTDSKILTMIKENEIGVRRLQRKVTELLERLDV